MELSLKRIASNANGIFSYLLDEKSSLIAVCLEHAYANANGFSPKIPYGEFKCIRGKHLLNGMNDQFETFEITGIPGHTGILFHWGNFNKDSEGCVLLGKEIEGNMITESRKSFADFMNLLQGIDSFNLLVVA